MKNLIDFKDQICPPLPILWSLNNHRSFCLVNIFHAFKFRTGTSSRAVYFKRTILFFSKIRGNQANVFALIESFDIATILLAKNLAKFMVRFCVKNAHISDRLILFSWKNFRNDLFDKLLLNESWHSEIFVIGAVGISAVEKWPRTFSELDYFWLNAFFVFHNTGGSKARLESRSF